MNNTYLKSRRHFLGGVIAAAVAPQFIPSRVLGSESDFPAHVPPLVVADFNLSSVSDAS